MTITLRLQPQEEARLLAIAQAKGVSTDDLIRQALNQVLADSVASEETQQTDSRPIWEALLDNSKDVPPEEFAKLPKDGASQHDHYLYAQPKRER